MDKYFLANMKGDDELLELLTKEFLSKNNEYLTDGEDYELMEGFKVLPEKEAEVETEVEDLYDEKRSEFPSESLFEYLKENSSSKNGKLTKYILHETDDGYQLQHHLRLKLLEAHTDSDEDTTTSDKITRQQMQELLVQELNDRYRNSFAGFPQTTKERMLKYLIKNLVSREGGTTFGTAVDAASEMEDEKTLRHTFADIASLDNVLRNFTIRGKSSPLSHRKVMGHTKENANGETVEVPPMDISNVVFMPKNRVNKKTLEKWLRIVENQRGAIRQRIAPIISIIRGRLKTGERVINLEADYVLGKLSLRELSRREEIYKYWERVSTTEYDNLQKTYDDLRKEFADLFSDREDIDPELRKVLTAFYDFKPDMENGTLNYIAELAPMDMKSVPKKQKPAYILERFLQENNLLDKKKDTLEEMSEQWEYTGQKSGREADHILTDAEGKEIDTREYDPTTGGAEKVNKPSPQDPVKKPHGPLDPLDTFRLPPGKEGDSDTFVGVDTRELMQLGIELTEFEDVKVDPLYYHAFTKDSGVFSDTQVFKQELEKIKRAMLSGARVGETVTEVNVDDKIFDFIEKLEDLVISEKKKFYLPISDTLKNLDIGDETEIDNKLKRVGEFLEVISQFFDTGSSLSRSASPSRAAATKQTTSKDRSTGTAFDTTFPGRKNRKNLLKDIEEVGETWNAFIEAMKEFYILPMNSKYRPFNDNIAETYKTSEKINRVWSMLTSDKAEETAFFKFLALEASEGVALLNEDDFTIFLELMEFIAEPDVGVDVGELRNLLNKARKRVTWILGSSKKGNIADEVKIEFGAYFHKVLMSNDLEMQEIFGKDSEDWADRYNPDTVYPFEAMVYHIERNREGYTQELGGTDAGSGKIVLAQKFLDALNNMNFGKSEYEQALMRVHDEIRKMEGKPIYHNTAKLDNYSHVSKAIKLVEERYHVELTAYELDSIVKEVNSMEELSIKHGVPKESVYFLKANFR